ncbi:hypothetical protein D3C73_1287160 [compost metagenome]
MFDRADTGFKGAVDGAGGVGVGGNVAVGGLGFLHRGAHLFHGVLGGVDAIRGGGDAAGRHDLDVVGALTDLVASGGADRVHAIGYAPDAAASTAVGVMVFAGQAHVAVTAGLAERVSAEMDFRTLKQALSLSHGQPEIGAGEIADSREAATQHLPHDPGRLRVNIGRRRVGQ